MALTIKNALALTQTVFVSIGNSDDKLSQKQWAKFCAGVREAMRAYADTYLGEWYSKPGEKWQNMCVAGDVDRRAMTGLLSELEVLREEYRQDSIAVLRGATMFVDGS